MILRVWELEVTAEFKAWWIGLDDSARRSIRRVIDLLETQGTALGYPHSSDVRRSRHGHMRELRVKHRGRPVRVFYAFDHRRIGMLLIGGTKSGNDRFYDRMVPFADRLLDDHINSLDREGAT